MSLLKEQLMTKIISEDDINVKEIIELEQSEREEVEELISKKIFEQKSKYYKYIPYLNKLDIITLMSNRFIGQIQDKNDRLMLLTYLYVRNPKPDTLSYIVEKSRNNAFGLSMLKEILKFYPQNREIAQIIEDNSKFISISDTNIKSNSSETEKSQNSQITYYKLSNGLIVKIDNEKMTLYILDCNRKEWRRDSELYAEYAYGVLNGEKINFNDTYPIGEELDLSRGKVL